MRVKGLLEARNSIEVKDRRRLLAPDLVLRMPAETQILVGGRQAVTKKKYEIFLYPPTTTHGRV